MLAVCCHLHSFVHFLANAIQHHASIVNHDAVACDSEGLSKLLHALAGAPPEFRQTNLLIELGDRGETINPFANLSRL